MLLLVTQVRIDESYSFALRHKLGYKYLFIFVATLLGGVGADSSVPLMSLVNIVTLLWQMVQTAEIKDPQVSLNFSTSINNVLCITLILKTCT